MNPFSHSLYILRSRSLSGKIVYPLILAVMFVQLFSGCIVPSPPRSRLFRAAPHGADRVIVDAYMHKRYWYKFYPAKDQQLPDSICIFDPVRTHFAIMTESKQVPGLYNYMVQEDRNGKKVVERQQEMVVKVYRKGVWKIDTLSQSKMD